MWNNPRNGDKPRYNIRPFDHLADESYKSRYVDIYNVYWDNAKELPLSIADKLESFIKAIEE